MGFWSTVGSIASGFVNQMEEKIGEVQEETSKIEGLSNQKLMEIVKGNSMFDSANKVRSARYLLKKRGVIKDD